MLVSDTETQVVFGGTSLTLNGSGATLNGNLQVNGAITSTGNVTAGGIDLQGHVHTGVQSGGALTGGPQG